MKRYVIFRQACNCQGADPMPSMRTTRAYGSLDKGEQDYSGLTVLFHPLVCPKCMAPYEIQPDGSTPPGG